MTIWDAIMLLTWWQATVIGCLFVLATLVIATTFGEAILVERRYRAAQRQTSGEQP